MHNLTLRAAPQVQKQWVFLTITLLLALAGFASTGSAAAATPQPEGEVRWSISPAGADGPDGRKSIENELDPGRSADEFLSVRNASEQEVTFRLAASDGFYTRAGRFDTLAAGQPSTALGSWISLQEEITIPADGKAVVPFTIAIPANAEPGDYAAGITASVLSLQSAEGGASVGVESRVGFRVNTRVTGDITPSASLHNAQGTYSTSWNPIRAGSATISFEVTNTGNTRLFAAGSVEVGSDVINFPADGEPRQELLPGDSRTITVTAPEVVPLFIVPLHISLTPEAVTATGAAATAAPVMEDIVMWAPPVPQMLVPLGVVLLTLSLLWGRTRRRRRMATLLERAREEGRRSAADSSAIP